MPWLKVAAVEIRGKRKDRRKEVDYVREYFNPSCFPPSLPPFLLSYNYFKGKIVIISVERSLTLLFDD